MLSEELGDAEVELGVEFVNNLRERVLREREIVRNAAGRVEESGVRTLPHLMTGKRRMEKLSTQIAASSPHDVIGVICSSTSLTCNWNGSFERRSCHLSNLVEVTTIPFRTAEVAF